MSRFVISCGGSGGHLAPGIALAEGLVERGHECSLVISSKQVDMRLIEKYPDLEFMPVPGVGLNMSPKGIVKFIWEQSKGILQSIRFLKEKKPDLIVGFGGFTTLGIVLAGSLLGYPIALHEANRTAGKAVRLLSFFSRRVYLPPGVQLKSLPPRTIRHFGYPVRKEIRYMHKHAACKKLGMNPHVKRLLVLGGSQGATALNQWVIENFEHLAGLGISVYCVTGLGKCSQGKLEFTSENGESVQAIFKPFIDNMAEVLCSADLVVSRAGAGSVAEFSRCCVPSILVPYPFAADQHQDENASYMERQGGGIVLPEKYLNKLYSEVTSLIFNEALLDKMQRNLARMESYNSLNLIVEDLESLCHGEQPKEIRRRHI